MTGNPAATVLDGVLWVEALVHDLDVSVLYCSILYLLSLHNFISVILQVPSLSILCDMQVTTTSYTHNTIHIFTHIYILCILFLQRSQVQEIADSTAIASSTKGNPVVLTVDELKEILNDAY